MKTVELVRVTRSIVSSIDPAFFFLKTSFKSLTILEILTLIFSNAGLTLVIDHENTVEEKQLKISELLSNIEITEVNQLELAFYLGMLCTAVVHANLPITKDFLIFGKVVNEDYIPAN